MNKHLSTIFIIIIVFASPQVYSDSGEQLVKSLLNIGLMSGTCIVYEDMIAYQKTAKLGGGDEFILKFWSAELAKTGRNSLEEFLSECKTVYEAHESLLSKSKTTV